MVDPSMPETVDVIAGEPGMCREGGGGTISTIPKEPNGLRHRGTDTPLGGDAQDFSFNTQTARFNAYIQRHGT